MERQGCQRAAKLSQDQAKRFIDLCEAADMRIDELEAQAVQTAAQRHQELTQARQWFDLACNEVNELRVLVTSRADGD